jgi:hypothetical protein
MLTLSRAALLVVGLAVLAGASRAEDPAFKKKPEDKEKEKEFFANVGETIVKAARTNPKKMEMTGFKIEPRKDKPTRKMVSITMVWFGSTTGTKFTSEIKLDCDASDKDRWEVLTIEYKDNNRVPRVGSEARIKELVKRFNR